MNLTIQWSTAKFTKEGIPSPLGADGQGKPFTLIIANIDFSIHPRENELFDLDSFVDYLKANKIKLQFVYDDPNRTGSEARVEENRCLRDDDYYGQDKDWMVDYCIWHFDDRGPNLICNLTDD